jgi:hypothetical protein
MVLVVLFFVAFVCGLTVRPVLGDMGDLGPTWWHSFSVSERAHLVPGMLDAYSEGYDDGSFQALETVAKRQGDNGDWVFDTRRHVKFPNWSKTPKHYADGISAFYAKYTESGSNVSVGQVIGCLADSPFMSCSDLAKAAEGG